MSTLSPGQLPLAPLGAGDLIDRAVRLYRRHLFVLIRTAAPPVIIIAAGWILFSISFRQIFITAETWRSLLLHLSINPVSGDHAGRLSFHPRSDGRRNAHARGPSSPQRSSHCSRDLQSSAISVLGTYWCFLYCWLLDTSFLSLQLLPVGIWSSLIMIPGMCGAGTLSRLAGCHRRYSRRPGHNRLRDVVFLLHRRKSGLCTANHAGRG